MRRFGNRALSAGLSRSVSSQVRRVSPGVCVARERARREEAGRGGKGGGVRGDRDREEEGRARGVPRPSCCRCRSCPGRIAKTAANKQLTLGAGLRLWWAYRSACDGHIVVFATRAFFAGDVVLINVFYSHLHTFRGGECSQASRAGDVAERAELGCRSGLSKEDGDGTANDPGQLWVTGDSPADLQGEMMGQEKHRRGSSFLCAHRHTQPLIRTGNTISPFSALSNYPAPI